MSLVHTTVYGLSYGLPHYMSWQSTKAYQMVPMPRGCGSQCLVMPGIAKRCRVFLPMMCRVFCLYVLSYGLLDYMSRQSAEAAKRLPMLVPGGAKHCHEMPSSFACNVDAKFFCLYVLSYGLPHYMSEQSAEAAKRLPMPVPGGAEHCQEMPSFLTICPELQVATLYVQAVC